MLCFCSSLLTGPLLGLAKTGRVVMLLRRIFNGPAAIAAIFIFWAIWVQMSGDSKETTDLETNGNPRALLESLESLESFAHSATHKALNDTDARSQPSPERCKHHRNTTFLEEELTNLRHLIVKGKYAAIKGKLRSWTAENGYVHNLKSPGTDYSQMHCSDLDFLATHAVNFINEWDEIADSLDMTILELALHMTKDANERALMKALHRDELSVGKSSEERIEERIKIIRLLLETGFLWKSDDRVVCRVVNPENGYDKNIRDAFARTILHDLVRDPIHLNASRMSSLRDSCFRKQMDGVVRILGQAPDAFALPGLLNGKTVLMIAAEDQGDHDSALVNFPELIQLHIVVRASLTVVTSDGWNAEMLAARKLRRQHVDLLQKTVADMWHQQIRDWCFSAVFLPQGWSHWLADHCAWLSLNAMFMAYVGAFFFIFVLLFDIGLFCCKHSSMLANTVRLLQCLRFFSNCGCTLVGSEMCFRILWLLTLNTAFLKLPPEIVIAWEQRCSLFDIPSVSKWNPLPLTVDTICWICLLLVLSFGISDFCRAWRKSQGSSWRSLMGEGAAATPEDRYQDPACHILACVSVFGLTMLLVVLYLQIVLQPLEMDPKKTALWFGAVLVQVKITLDDSMAKNAKDLLRAAFDNALVDPPNADSEAVSLTHEQSGSDDKIQPINNAEYLYKAIKLRSHEWHRWASCMVTPCNIEIWQLLIFAQENDKHICSKKCENKVQWSWLEITLRFSMSYISNGFCKAILVYTLPLWLCRGGLSDFVLNSFALVYIIELDDLSQHDDWKLDDRQTSSCRITERSCRHS